MLLKVECKEYGWFIGGSFDWKYFY